MYTCIYMYTHITIYIYLFFHPRVEIVPIQFFPERSTLHAKPSTLALDPQPHNLTGYLQIFFAIVPRSRANSRI